ncbi:hypothetical protein ACQ858_07235 [Variovorax ureilyticus]
MFLSINGEAPVRASNAMPAICASTQAGPDDNATGVSVARPGSTNRSSPP